MSPKIPSLVARNLELAFSLGGSLVERCLVCKVVGPLNGLTVMANSFVYSDLLISTYRPADIGGTSVEVGDERGVGRASDLTDGAVPDPEPGDYFVNESGIRRDIVAARLDPTGTFWVYQLRRATVDDFADLTKAFY